jgi:hypothetical protein
VTRKSNPAALDPAELRTRIEGLIHSWDEPVLAEEGEAPIQLAPDRLLLTAQGDRLLLEAWNDSGNLRRRIVAIGHEKRGSLELVAERFGGRTCRLLLYDRARPAIARLDRRAGRLVHAERLRLFLRRQFPGWKLTEATSHPDLEHSLSPAYPRAFVRRGGSGWAAILAPPDTGRAEGVLAFGLIWLDYLRRRERTVTVEGLALYLPAGQECTTCLRVGCLNQQAMRLAVFLYDADGGDWEVDPVRHGNLQTTLEPAGGLRPRSAPDGPEAVLEALIRANPRRIDARLDSMPVYGQVPAIAGIDRGVLDLLAIDATGRLTVVELKATADVQLPVQALDYWMRVRWHAQRGDFARLGFFPGRAPRADPPRLLLVAPAMEFHSTTETMLRFYDPAIEVERVGIGMDWRTEIRVAFRLRGSARPG